MHTKHLWLWCTIIQHIWTSALTHTLPKNKSVQHGSTRCCSILPVSESLRVALLKTFPNWNQNASRPSEPHRLLWSKIWPKPYNILQQVEEDTNNNTCTSWFWAQTHLLHHTNPLFCHWNPQTQSPTKKPSAIGLTSPEHAITGCGLHLASAHIATSWASNPNLITCLGGVLVLL